MLFTNLSFLYFHLLVVLLRWSLPGGAVQPLLLLSSYAFYLSWGAQYGFLIGGMTLVGWVGGLAIERFSRQRKWILGATIAALLTVLSYFKYANFFGAQWASLLSLAGIVSTPFQIDVVLPLAISFFTFEVISYVVDVYRGETAERSPLKFALYVAYYPHLIAGPIVRAHELLPNLHRERPFASEMFCEGVFIALVGYIKKTVIADNLSPWADAVFLHPEAHATFGVWMGVVAYTGQIFCDFSGYTDIARGASLMLGYPLPENFNYPYLSLSITEFWRRWHMTLSRWLRDYLYISLGGNRGGTIRQYRNLFITMLLGGLWHGANWTFVFWGALHGLALMIHKAWSGFASRGRFLPRIRASLPYAVVAWALTLLTVMLGWVYFRAPDFANAHLVLARMTHSVTGAGAIAATVPDSLGKAIFMTLLLLCGHVLGHKRVMLEANRQLPPLARGMLWAAMIVFCFLLAETRAQFIYFQF